MNASIDMNASSMTVTLRGLDVVWATRRRIVVPLGHIRGARYDAQAARHGPWLGAGRTDALLDYAVAAGPMRVHGRREFWDVRDPGRAVAIDLAEEQYDRLVIEVDDPAATVEAVNAAVERKKQEAA